MKAKEMKCHLPTENKETSLHKVGIMETQAEAAVRWCLTCQAVYCGKGNRLL